MNPITHQSILQKETGGRAVDPSRNVCWDDNKGGYYLILVPANVLHPRGDYVALNIDTSDEYINSAIELQDQTK